MKPQIKKQLKEKILETMKERGISQAQLGVMVGGAERRVINRQLVAENTSIEKLLEFAEALEIRVELVIK